MVIDNMLILHFVDPDLGVEVSLKKMGIIGGWSICSTHVLQVEENLMQRLSAFLIFLVTEKE